MEGHIKLHRAILESQVFAHPTSLKIWIWCLVKASYKERFVPLKIGRGVTSVRILPGQFIFGRNKAQDELGIDGSTIYKWMQKFASEVFENMISLESNNQYTIVTLLNWAHYQSREEQEVTTEEQPSNSQVTAEEQRSNTNKKDNKDKNISPTWRDDFEIYRKEAEEAYLFLSSDKDFIKEREEFYPGIDIPLSLKLAYTDFWGKPEGWKKKKSSKSKTLDWRSTYSKALGINKVWKQKGANNDSGETAPQPPRPKPITKW